MKNEETKISFIDLNKQQKLIKNQISSAINKVLSHGHYIMGPEIEIFETDLKKFCGADYAVTCANGTDALILSLMAYDIKPNDMVVVPSFTFTSTAESVCVIGAKPFFVDVEKRTFNLDIQDLKDSLIFLKKEGSLPKAIIAVDLFGQPSRYSELKDICDENKIILIIDAAQSFGAEYKRKKVGTFGHITTTSFFPAKPLGCYGDGGAIFTNDENIANKIKSLRVHGKGKDKYDNVRIGLNSRLDTIQAAILIEKLKIFPKEIELRNKISKRYDDQLSDCFLTPQVLDDCKSVWAQYTIIIEDVSRDLIQESLMEKKIPSTVYYPMPLHMQSIYRNFPISSSNLENSRYISRKCLSLPMHPYISEFEQNYVINNLKELI